MKRRFTILTAAIALLAFLAVPMGMRGQAPVGTTLWGETWTGGDANETPSAYGFEGTTIYGGATLTYAQSSTNTKLYEEALAGGESPELLLSKSNQTWTISNIPTGQATGMALTFKSNKTTFDVTSTTTGITISGSQKSWTIASTSSVTTFNLTIKNTGSSNARIDDIVLSVTTAGGDTPQPTTYTVTYDANGGSGTMTDSDSPYAAGATVTVLGNEFTRTDYEFDHWNTAADDSGTSYDEDDTFTINANTTLYAQWTENTTPTPSGITATLNIQAYAQANNWTNGTKYTTATVAPVTFTANGGGNTGKYYSNGQDWRFYQNESASITISVLEGFTLVSVTPTYSVSNGGVLKNGNATITSGTTVNVSGTSVTFTVGNSGSATNGQVRFTNIDVTYVSNGGTIPPSITANNVEIAYDAEEGIINYTINNPVEGGSIVASCDAEWIEVDDTPQTDAEGSIDFICAPNSNFYAHSATVTLTYTYGDSKATVTKDVTVTQALNPDANGSTIDYPIMVSEAIEAIDEVGSVSNIYVGGIVSEITASTSSYITFKMYDEDGDDYYLQAYHCTGNNFNEVAVGDQVVVYGTLEKYGTSVYQFASGCQLVSLIHPAVPSITVNPDEVNVDATPAAGEDFIEGTLDLTWENLEITDFFEDFAIQYYDAEGEELADDPNWIMVDLATQDPNIGEGYLVSYMIEENEGTEARTAYFKVFALGDEDYVYSNLVTITQAAPVVPATGDEYALYTGELVEGDYLIVYDGGAMNTTVTNDRLQFEDVTATNDVIVTDNAEIVWHIAPSGQYWTIYNADADAYAASTGAKNKAQMLADGTDDKALWTVSGTETYEFVNKKNTANNVNANLRKNGTYGFACYATSTGGALSLYKKVASTETYNLENITGYTGEKDHYFLIASPVTVDLTNHDMTTGDFDLYYFDQAQEDEWRNYEATPFNLVPGTGYLYAKEATTENPTYSFELTGIPYAGNGTIDLDYDANAEFPGFNLIGNPFGTNANLDLPYYRLNSDGSALNTSTESTQVFVMEGVFVEATSTIRTATFSPAAKRVSQLNVKVTRNRGAVLDNAIIRFDNGAVLGKFQLNPNSTKVYITEGNQDFAVVRSNNEGEMPVSFKAAENGNYTFSVEAENVEVSYLHLIDNMTGTDVDLLATPSYSFDARTTDNANRFRLVFNTNGVDENTTTASFAYFNGSEWTINNMGEATLQIVDLMGRVLSTQAISGNTEVSISQVPGVYMLRLINGENVMVQKVVVR